MRAMNLLRSGDYELGSIQEALVLRVWANERKRETLKIMIPVMATFKSEGLNKTIDDYFKTIIPIDDAEEEMAIAKDLEAIKNISFETKPLTKEPDRGILELPNGK